MEQKLENDIKTFITCPNPILFNKFVTTWPLMNFSLLDWSSKFKTKELPIRIGKKSHSEPQWERGCDVKKMSFDDFLKYFRNSEDNWAYFDYKYMHEWFDDDIDELFDWKMLGIEGKSCRDTTLWIGSSGAHTPCHYDAYSFNLVAQIYGCKRWILIPPGTEMQTTVMKPCRIPYEESSIYSQLNFFSPENVDHFKDISGAIITTLHPGDVLYVPKHWWHFVENIDLSISINTWVPVESDDESRLEESLVRMFISSVTSKFNDFKDGILNPNEDNITEENTLKYLTYFAKESKKFSSNLNSSTFKEEEKYHQLTNKYSNIKILTESPKEELKQLLKNNSKRFLKPINHNKSNQHEELKIMSYLVNSFCHPRVINLVKELFIEECNKT